MIYDIEKIPAELEIPNNEIAEHKDLVEFLNDISTATANSDERPDFSKWIFDDSSVVLTAILKIQEYKHEGEMISLHWTSEQLDASWFRVGVFAEIEP